MDHYYACSYWLRCGYLILSGEADMTKEELLDLFALEAMKSAIASSNGVINTYKLAGDVYNLASHMIDNRQKVLDQWAAAEDSIEISINKLGLTVRAENCLKAENIYTFRDLQKYTENELLKTPNLGRRSLGEIIFKMQEHGLKLKGRAWLKKKHWT